MQLLDSKFRRRLLNAEEALAGEKALVVHGRPFCGKTHLAANLALNWLSTHEDQWGRFVPCRTFVRECYAAQDPQLVIIKLLHYDLLLLDGVYCDKGLHFIQSLIKRAKKIIITTSDEPQKIQLVFGEDRFRAMFKDKLSRAYQDLGNPIVLEAPWWYGELGSILNDNICQESFRLINLDCMKNGAKFCMNHTLKKFPEEAWQWIHKHKGGDICARLEELKEMKFQKLPVKPIDKIVKELCAPKC